MVFEGYLELGGGEVLNSARSKGYTSTAPCPVNWLQCPPCDGIRDVLGSDEYTYETIFDAPWYDAEDEVTHRFLGAHALTIEGLPDSTREADTAEAILDGGVVGRVRNATRRMRVRAILTALGEDALEAGFAWLNSALTPGKCATHADACGASDMQFFTACPPSRAEITKPETFWNDPVTNQASNPSFEASGPAITTRVNVITRPNMELAYGSLQVRRNLALSPQKSNGPAGWNLSNRWFGPAGSTGVWETIPAAVPGAPGVTTAVRKVWTTVGGVPQDVSYGVLTARTPVVPGEKYTVSFYIRPSWNTGTPTDHWFDFGGFNVASGGTVVQQIKSPRLPVMPANVWTRLSHTFTIPAGVTYIEGGHTLYCDSNLAYWPTPGHSLDATGLLVERYTDFVGTFFDGTTQPDGDGLSFAFSGVAQQSESVAYGQQVSSNANDDLIGYQSGPAGNRHIKIVPKWSQGGWGMVLRDAIPAVNGKTYTAMIDVTLNQEMNVDFRLERGTPHPVQFAYGILAAGSHHLVVNYSYNDTGQGQPVIALGLRTQKNGTEVIRVDNVLVTEGVYDGPYFDGSTPAKVRRNLVHNPTFAVDISWWYGYYGPGFARDTSDYFSTPGSLRLSRGSGPVQGAINERSVTPTVGDVHHLSARVKAPMGMPYRLTLKHDAGSAGIGGVAGTGDGTWQFHELTYTIPAGFVSDGYLTPMIVSAESEMSALGIAVGQPFLWLDDVLWEINTTGPYFDGSTPIAPYAAAWEGAVSGSWSYLHDPDFTYVWGGTPNDSESLQRSANPQGIGGVNVAATQSTRWAGNRTKSLRLTPNTGSQDSFGYIEGDIGSLHIGMVPGRTYTAQVTVHLEAPQTTPQPNARTIEAFYGQPSVGYTKIMSPPAPNVAGDHLISVTFTLPANANEAFIRLQVGSAVSSDEVWWDNFSLVEGIYGDGYFDGSFADSPADDHKVVGKAVSRYEWTGTADASTSTHETGIVVAVEDPETWQLMVDRLTRYLHTVTCVSGPIVEQKLHRGDTWGYIVEFVLVAGVPWMFGITKPVALQPSLPVVVQDVPFNLVPYPSAELSAGTVVAATNFSLNPSVETGTTAWQADGTVGPRVLSQSTELASVGANSAKVVASPTAGGSAGWFSAEHIVDLPALPAGTRMSFNQWASASVQSGTAVLGTIEIFAVWFTGATYLTETLIGSGPASGGAKSSKSVAVPAGANKVLLRAKLNVTSWSAGAVIRLYSDAAAVTVP